MIKIKNGFILVYKKIQDWIPKSDSQSENFVNHLQK